MAASELPNVPTISVTLAPNSTNSTEQQPEISIPSGSFTAFRFVYGDATEFSRSSKVLLLGAIPKIWYKEHNNQILRSISKASYKGAPNGVAAIFESNSKFGLPDLSNDPNINKLSKILTRMHLDDDSYDEESDDSANDDYYDGGHRWDHQNSLHPSYPPSVTDPSTASSHQHLALTNGGGVRHEIPIPNGILASNLAPPRPAEQSTNASDSFHSAQEIVSPATNFLQSEIDDTVIHEITAESIKNNNLLYSNQTFDSNSTISSFGPNQRRDSKVLFQDVNRSRRSSQMISLKPVPAINPQMVPLTDKPLDIEKVIKKVASKTKYRLKQDVSKINQRKIFHKLLKVYSVGEIIKMEKMLVLVKVKSQSQANYATFTEVEPCDTRVIERWKEYIVVARSTGDVNSPVLLQFYTKREIPDKLASKHSDDSLDFTLDRQSVVNFYSSLDKTIAVNRGEKVYIMRCQTQSSSIRWLTFLKETLGITLPTVLKVEVPNLNISMNLAITNEIYNIVHNKENIDSVMKLYLTEQGYTRQNPQLIEYLSAKIRAKLCEIGYADVANYFKDEIHKLGFCWRHYDRLEWIFGEALYNLFWQQSMNETHVLELRKLEHFSSHIGNINEPTPIEGFLARITTNEGSLKRGVFQRQVFKFSYFFTSDHYLFFLTSFKSLPPLPYSKKLMEGNSITSDLFVDLENSATGVYEHNPFPLDDNNRINWLLPGLSTDEFQKRDGFAIRELERRIGSIIRADNILDLNDVENVEIFDYHSVPLTVDVTSELVWNNNVTTPDQLKQLKKERDCYFRILMKNDSILVLRAKSPEVRDEWVRRLNELREYWILKVDNDVEIMEELKAQNIEQLRINDFSEKNISESTKKWENSKGIADPAVFNVTPYSLYRPIIKSGVLYQKPKKHSTFRKFNVVLVPGFIILYHIFQRGITGSTHKSSYHSHYMTIPIAECYIYTGSICGLDLIETEKEIDSLMPGENYIPRVYEDGSLSSDDESLRCFTLWFGTKRAISGKGAFTNEFQRLSRMEAPANPGLFKMVNRLGVTGRSMVFMCKSRQERDIWVTNLYTQLERFGIASTDN